tara:strand:+ start:67 stop:1137 length:1071 start_codon:yes stop_codon:yes gene_type:complete
MCSYNIEHISFKCNDCDYITSRKYNLTRHYNAKHKIIEQKIVNEQKSYIIEQKPYINEQKSYTNEQKSYTNEQKSYTNEQKSYTNQQKSYIIEEENEYIIEDDNEYIIDEKAYILENKENIIEDNEEDVITNEEINNKNIMECSLCSKKYLTLKRYNLHISKCKGINILTCPKCMKTFCNTTSKSRHIKNNKCKAKSIIYANQPHMIINNNIIQHNSINITINNYGSERMDYITNNEISKIIRSTKIIPKYIKFKHFNPDFPENHNIKFKDDRFFIKTHNEWEVINKYDLTNKLVGDNSYQLYSLYIEKKEDIDGEIKNEEIIEDAVYVLEKAIEGLDNKNVNKNVADIITQISIK